MRDVRLHGELAELVGTDHLRLEVDGPRDLVRALVVQVPGARRVIESSSWRVLEGDRELGLEHLPVRSTRERPLELIPVLEGAGQNGAGTGKLIAGILLIAVAIFAPPIGLPLLGTISPLLIGGLGASLALSGLSQLLAPVPAMDYMQPEPADRRQSELFAGASNLLGTGHAIPLVYGTMRVGSVQVSSRIVTTDASIGPKFGQSNELVSVARLDVVDVVSEGEIEGLLTADAVSILFNGTRVEEEQGTVNFQDVEWDVTLGAVGEPATVYGVETVYPVNTEATNVDGTDPERILGAVSRTISDPNVDNVRLTLRVPALYYTSGSPPVAWNFEYTIEVDADGGGFEFAHVGGVPNAFQGSAAYNTVGGSSGRISYGLGFFISPVWNTYPGATVTFRFFYRVTGTTPWTEVVVTRNIVAYGGQWAVEDWGYVNWPYDYVVVPALPDEEREFYWVCDEGPPDSGFGIGDGLLVDLLTNVQRISGLALSPYDIDVVLTDMSAYGPPPWTIRVGKVSIDRTDPTQGVNGLWWDRYAEGIEREFTYPEVARVSVAMNADDVGNQIPTRLYEVEGIKLEIPSNLTTSTRTYTGVWDGTFSGTREFYDNPAWVLWDVLRSSRYGLGLAESEIDKWSVYEAAKWCDELVDDGAGGTAPRFRFNHVFTNRQDALQLIQAVASAMQAQLWWGGGQLFVTQDRPAEVARHFTNANVIEGVFTYGSVGRSARTTVAKVSWRNPDLAWESDVDLVDRPYAIDRFGRNESDVLAIGATNYAQARRRGRYDVLTSELEGGTVTFRVAAESALVEPGQVIETSDKHRETVRYGGRVAAWVGGSNRIDFDYGFEFAATGETLRVMLDDQSIHVTTITSTGGGGGGPPPEPHDTDDYKYTLDTPLPVGRTILVGAPWILTVNERKLWRVLTIKPTAGNTFELECVAHDPTKQDQVEDFADIGAPLSTFTQSTPSTPTLVSATPIYDAALDLWSLRIIFIQLDTSAVWMIGGAVGVGVAVSREATTRDSKLIIPLAAHSVVGGYDFDVTISSVTADGIGYSAPDTTTVSIPSTVP